MSRSYVYFATEDGVRKSVAAFQNSYGFGFYIFEALTKKYRTQIQDVTPTPGLIGFTEWGKLWEWVKSDENPKIPAFELHTLVAGYDGAYIQGAEDIRRLSESFALFAQTHKNMEHIQHLTAMSKSLLEGLERGTEYVSFYPMSVVPDHWNVPDGDGESHSFEFGNPLDALKVSSQRYKMTAEVNSLVCLKDLL